MTLLLLLRYLGRDPSRPGHGLDAARIRARVGVGQESDGDGVRAGVGQVGTLTQRGEDIGSGPAERLRRAIAEIGRRARIVLPMQHWGGRSATHRSLLGRL